ncbi:MAG: glycoside hydrolase family 30 protein [Bacteroidetes bacterium]|nr:glycoside hydrolase family 30 protein [Bacteroidota bacterium]
MSQLFPLAIKDIFKKAIFLLALYSTQAFAQQTVSWVASSPTSQWVAQSKITAQKSNSLADVIIHPEQAQQTIEGFGACFKELGWTSLSLLSSKDRAAIFKELFKPNTGANFTICRMPVGANDFSRNWYSYNETDGDFEMKQFSIANDYETLIPFIKNAQKYNPALKLWASPWSPPTWMKYNKHYASQPVPDISSWPKEQLQAMRDNWGMDFKGISNGMKPEQRMHEGSDMFIQEEKYFAAYSLYFSKFIDAYKKAGIKIGMVMPQNEFNSDQVFPSCTWTAAGLVKFISYLGPAMKKKGVDLFFGTMERPNKKLVDTILTDPLSREYIKGVGFQWAGKEAIPAIHKEYPGLSLYQSEQECGNGYNDWKYCTYAWSLMKHYLNNGVKSYFYWNISLKEGGVSTWGWHQNSLIIVDTLTRTFKYSYEYYLMKHLSHYVKPNAKKIVTTGTFTDLLVFENPDKSLAIIIHNPEDQDKTVQIQLNGKILAPTLKAKTINTLLVK